MYTDPSGYAIQDFYLGWHNANFAGGGSEANNYGPDYTPYYSFGNLFGRSIAFHRGMEGMYFGWAKLFFSGVTNTRFWDFLFSGGKYNRDGRNVLHGKHAIHYLKQKYNFVYGSQEDPAGNMEIWGVLFNKGFSLKIPYYRLTGSYYNPHPLFSTPSVSNEGVDIYNWSNLGLNAVNLLSHTIKTRQLPEMLQLEALGAKYIQGVKSAGTWCTRMGVGTSIASGFVSVVAYMSIENPTWGNKAQLAVGLTSSVLSAIPYTTYVGVGIGLTDVAGGFNGWYNAWNSSEIMYNTVGWTVLPINSPTGMPIIIGW